MKKGKTLFYMFRSILLFIAAYLLVGLVLAMTPFGQLGGGMYLSALMMLAGGIAVLLTIKKDEFHILSKEKSKPWWFMVLSLAILSLGVTVFFNRVLEYIPWEYFPGENVIQDNDTFFGIPVIWRMVIYVGIAPLAEELLFRGAVFARLRKVVPVWCAVLISALFFGIYHLNWMQGIYAVIMGSVMALLFEWYDSFLAALLFHMLANFWVNLAVILPKWNDFLSSPAGMLLAVAFSLIGGGMVVLHGMIWTKRNKRNRIKETE